MPVNPVDGVAPTWLDQQNRCGQRVMVLRGSTMSNSYVDVDTGAVTGAGRATAATSTQWAEWASRSETLLRQAAVDCQEPIVTGALEGHLSEWNPRMQRLAGNADALGTNAVSAAHVMLNADSTSAATLGRQSATEQTVGSHLRRPIAG
jgi:hypothetical protein